MKKHQLIATEIKNHEGRIDAVSQTAQKLVEEGHFAADEIKTKLGELHDHWDQLKERCDQRRQELEDSIQAHQGWVHQSSQSDLNSDIWAIQRPAKKTSPRLRDSPLGMQATHAS